MKIKYCIAKMVGSEQVYLTNTANTWVSDINSESVKWHSESKDAWRLLVDPMWYVVPYEHIDTQVRVEAITLACKAISEAIRVGAINPETMQIEVPYEVFKNCGLQNCSVHTGELFYHHKGELHGVTIKHFSEVPKCQLES